MSFILCLFFLFASSSEAIDCNYFLRIKYDYINRTKITIQNPTLLANLTCEPKLNLTDYVNIFYPQILKDDTLQLENIFNMTNQDKWNTNVLALARVNGIVVDKSEIYKNMFFLNFKYSHLNIVFSNESKTNFVECSSLNFENFTFFRPFKSISFEKVTFSHHICPLIFNNSKVLEITFDDLTNSFLTRNELKFVPLNANLTFQASIFMSHFYVYYSSLDFNMLNQHLFKNVREISFHHILMNIEMGVLNSLVNLKNIDFKLDNYKQFFHSLGNKWMNDLNVNVRESNNYDLKKLRAKMFRLRFRFLKSIVSFNRVYEYPLEDACLFKEFPHERLVLPIVEPGKAIACTCTLAWLELKMLSRYGLILNVTNASSFYEDYELKGVSDGFHLFALENVYTFCNETNLRELKCDFKIIFNNCEVKSWVII